MSNFNTIFPKITTSVHSNPGIPSYSIKPLILLEYHPLTIPPEKTRSHPSYPTHHLRSMLQCD